MSLLPFSRNARSRGATVSPSKTAAAPLTLRQALTITAGLAGLAGLLGGGLIRFSIASSPNARFLSPLQTFPALSDWPSSETSGTPDGALEPQSPETTDVFPFEEDAAPLEEDSWQDELPGTESWDEDSELNWQTGDDFDTFSSERFTSAPKPLAASERGTTPSTFDAFANRSAERSRAREDDPLKALSKGPLLRGESSDELYELERDRPESF